jgi:hypothetical protein
MEEKESSPPMASLTDRAANIATTEKETIRKMHPRIKKGASFSFCHFARFFTNLLSLIQLIATKNNKEKNCRKYKKLTFFYHLAIFSFILFGNSKFLFTFANSSRTQKEQKYISRY